MDKAQYLCVKAVHNEVDSLIKDRWRVVVKYYHPEMGLQYYLKHDVAGVISIQTNVNLTKFSIYKNGVLKKHQNFSSKMERKINEGFTHNGIKYRVKEADIKYPYKCVKCGFYDHIDLKCRGNLCVTGDCRIRWRSDRKEVIFEEL